MKEKISAEVFCLHAKAKGVVLAAAAEFSVFRCLYDLRVVGDAVADGAEVVEGEQDAGLAGAGAQENRRHEQ